MRAGFFFAICSRWIICALALLCLLDGAAMAQTLRIGLASETTSIDPQFGNVSSNLSFAEHLFGTLVANDAKLRPQPALAASWKLRDDRTWEFKIRDNAVFSDGTPVTAEDAIYSFCRVLSLPVPAFPATIRRMQNVVAEDARTLVITMRTPYPLLINDLVSIAILPAKSARHGTLGFAPATGCGVSGFPQSADFVPGPAMLGAGPFILRSYTRGGVAEMVRNPRYWGRPAPWEVVRMSPATNSGPRLAGLLAGDFDLIENPSGADMARIRADKRFVLDVTPTPRLIFLQPDVDRTQPPFVDAGGRNPLKDARVREAISLAIDRTAIVERIMDGAAVTANQFLPDGMFGALEKPNPLRYDPARARALLAEAGYKDGFGITLHASNDRYINDAKVAQALGQFLTRVGIRAQVEAMPVSIYFTQRREKKFALALGGWNAASGEASSFLNTWTATPDPDAGVGGGNWGGFSDPTLDRLIRTALATMDDGVRQGVLREATAQAVRLLPSIPLYFESSSWAYRVGLKFAGRPDQFTLAADVMPAGK